MKHLVLAVALFALCRAGSFTYEGSQFLLNGEPIILRSGAFHYFRVHPDYWDDILMKMAHGGLNVIETYVAWNVHEPRKGEFNFEGFGDIVRFVNTAAKYDLLVMLRPGPYICAEWEFGGFPYWLLKEDNIKLRSSDPVYMAHVREYLDVFFAQLEPYMIGRGGNIIMVQIENEYGSYGICDKVYLRDLYDITVAHFGEAKDYVVFTSDGPSDGMIECGTLPDLALITVNFGPGDAKAPFAVLEKHQPNKPYQCSEFYPGWLDHWGEKHNHGSTANILKTMTEMYVELKASFNFYMYIGGTNFGFMNGANGGDSSIQIDPTSYDYDAPLSEAGDMTSKYFAIRERIREWVPVPDLPVQDHPKASYGAVAMTESASLFDVLETLDPSPVRAEAPLTFEKLDIGYGYVLYRSQLAADAATLSLSDVHDRATIFVNGEHRGLILRANPKEPVELGAQKGDVLDILVENQGRINYGGGLTDRKGLLGDVLVDGAVQKGWLMFRLAMDDLTRIEWRAGAAETKGPRFYRGSFWVDEPNDTFVNPTGWTKGHMYLNEHNLGKYWIIGPQLTVYSPKFFLKRGRNALTVFETVETKQTSMTLDDEHQIDIIKGQRLHLRSAEE